MASTTTATSLSFKPWTSDTREQPPLKDILARVNLERGHFRDITEASLQEEIAAEGALSSASSDDEVEDQDEEPAKRKAATTREELYAAKREMLEHVHSAHNDIMMTLDFISLLESKHAPSQANVSMSQELKSRAPPGSFGTDVWDPKAISVDQARQAQDALLASSVRMAGLQQSADGLLAAASRLQDNVRKEKAFWDQIMSISDKGWSVSKIPGSQFLGVHFGFNGSAPEFARRNVAALMPDSNGNIILERGVGTKPKTVQVVLRKGGSIVGRSKVPSLSSDDDTTLEARIRHARDSVYDEELLHELIREARTLRSMGVRMRGSTIVLHIPQSDDLTIELELVHVDQVGSVGESALHEYDHLAQATLLAARLILGQEHRIKTTKRKQVPAPLSDNKDAEQQVLSIIRPLMLLLQHRFTLNAVNSYISTMTTLIQKLPFPAEPDLARLGLASTETDTGSPDVQSLIESFRAPLLSSALVRIGAENDKASNCLRIDVNTHSSISLGTEFTVGGSSPLKPITFSNFEDTRAAADDFLAQKLGLTLKETLVEDHADLTWESREACVLRGTGRHVVKIWFEVDGSKSLISLHVDGQTQTDFRWSIDGGEDHPSLADICKPLLA